MDLSVSSKIIFGDGRMKHIVNFSGGKDSTAMLIRMIEEGMHIDDIVFIKVMATNEIGGDYPEMYEYIEKVEEYIGRKITIVPSINSFDKVFHQKYQTGKRAGVIYGFPVTIGAWCNDRLKLKTIRQHYKIYGEHINYLGIAADEPKRLAKLQPNCRAPLAEWGMNEQDCLNYCFNHGWNWRENGVELYHVLDRVSCWCCTNKNKKEIQNIIKYLQEYWSRIKDYEKRCGIPYKRKGCAFFEKKVLSDNNKA